MGCFESYLGMAGSLKLYDEKGTTRLNLGLMGSYPFLMLNDSQENTRVFISENEGRPSISVRDENDKAGTVIGCTNLKIKATGSVEQRSEASIVIFNEEGDVIWRYPL